MREWVECAFSSAKGSELWIDLWDRAAQIDYELAKFTNDEDLLAFLASNDIMEMHLRRLASKKYLSRTGDRSGAQHMLALQAPGQQSDVAPTWMVADATTHSNQNTREPSESGLSVRAMTRARATGRQEAARKARARGRTKAPRVGAPPLMPDSPVRAREERRGLPRPPCMQGVSHTMLPPRTRSRLRRSGSGSLNSSARTSVPSCSRPRYRLARGSQDGRVPRGSASGGGARWESGAARRRWWPSSIRWTQGVQSQPLNSWRPLRRRPRARSSRKLIGSSTDGR